MPSSSSDSNNSSPALTRKKRHIEAESSDSSDDRDTSDATAAEEEGTPQPLPSTEVVVLSHAERRRQKKKQQQKQLTATSEPPRKKRKLRTGTPSDDPDAKAKKTSTTTTTASKAKAAPILDEPKRLRRQNSIWVGNLSFRTTQDALRGFFDGVGTITRIHLPMRRGKQTPGENMGFAYVDFDTPEAKAIAITLSEGQLDGRNLLIKDGDDFTGRPVTVESGLCEGTGTGADGGECENAVKNATTAEGNSLSKTAQKILRAQKQPSAPTLFLGNLGFETTEASIRELFEAHRYWGRKEKGKGIDEGEGEGQGGDVAKSTDVWIRKIRMGTFEDSGNCKGFAFVDFTSIEHATEALVNPRNHRLNGRDLVVEYASPDAVRRGGGPRRPKGDAQKNGAGSRKGPQKASATVPHIKLPRPRETRQGNDAEPVEPTTPRLQRREHTDRDRSHMRRAKPGAALACAQRQSAAILPSQGEKIIF